MILESDTPSVFSGDHLDVLRLLADQVAGAVRLSTLNRRLSLAREEVEAANRQLHAANRALLQLSLVDGLTGLANRRHFDDVLEAEWRRAARGASSLALVLIDIDRFKDYNDTYGHVQGDACLRAVAGVLERSVQRAGDLVARYGGEEFAFVLPQLGRAEAFALAEQVRTRVKELQIPHLQTLERRPPSHHQCRRRRRRSRAGLLAHPADRRGRPGPLRRQGRGAQSRGLIEITHQVGDDIRCPEDRAGHS